MVNIAMTTKKHYIVKDFERLQNPCHICKKKRSNDHIDLLRYPSKYKGKYAKQGMIYLKFCNDNPECEKEAYARCKKGER